MTKNRKICQAVFLAYCLVMLYLLFGQRIGRGDAVQLQLQPLRTLRLFWRVLCNSADDSLRRQAWINLAGNVVMFVPLGFLVPCIFGKLQRFWRHFLCMTLIIVSVELLQLVTCLGTCDIDDLLLNLIGTTVGYLCWKLLNRKK